MVVSFFGNSENVDACVIRLISMKRGSLSEIDQPAQVEMNTKRGDGNRLQIAYITKREKE